MNLVLTVGALIGAARAWQREPLPIAACAPPGPWPQPAPAPEPAAERERTDLAVRSYLAQVYPAIARELRAEMSAAAVRALYESLDYYYDASAQRGDAMVPRVAFHPISAADGDGGARAAAVAPAPLPYLPAGVWYDARMPARAAALPAPALPWAAGGSYTRWPSHVLVLPAARAFAAGPGAGRGGARRHHSVVGSRYGPAPAWTSALAVVRYVWWPAGFPAAATEPPFGGCADGAGGFWPNRTVAAAAAADDSVRGAPQLPLRASQPSLADGDAPAPHGPGGRGGRLAALRALRDGDRVEIEGFGGPVWSVDRRSPGVWANLWRGTGVFLRVGAPFASTSKTGAIADMLLELGARRAAGGDAALRALGLALGVDAHVERLRGRYGDASDAELLITALFFLAMPAAGPCLPVSRRVRALERAWTRTAWVREARAGRLHPRAATRRLRFADAASAAPDAYALYWQLGACGTGPFYRARNWAAYDQLLATCACVLGVHTLLLGASPNDNGLLHQELIDYEAPDLSNASWRKIVARGARAPINALPRCAPAFVAEAGQPGRRPPTADELAAHWAATRKLALADPRDARGGGGGGAFARELPCQLFGGARPWRSEGAAGARSACAPDDDALDHPDFAHGGHLRCHTWCAGAMSEAHAAAPLAAMYVGGPTGAAAARGWAVARWVGGGGGAVLALVAVGRRWARGRAWARGRV